LIEERTNLEGEEEVKTRESVLAKERMLRLPVRVNFTKDGSGVLNPFTIFNFSFTEVTTGFSVFSLTLTNSFSFLPYRRFQSGDIIY
jgi:hypothetical protein